MYRPSIPYHLERQHSGTGWNVWVIAYLRRGVRIVERRLDHRRKTTDRIPQPLAVCSWTQAVH